MSNLVTLREGTVLVGDYRVERVLGAGGFGITYLAEETPLARRVTLKEYFPVDFAARNNAEDVVPRSQASETDYTWGLERFLAEAQTLARFTHPNIVRVYRYFRARNTGYIAMQFEEGQSFKSWLQNLGRAPRQPELDRILAPLLDALELIHNADFLHRDIAPDNIIIRKDGTPVLIDFGSARGEIASHTKTLSALVKPGYSPYEQYASTPSRQGPWTDIYSLAATLYHAVTGRRPPDAPTRMVADEMIPVRDAALSSFRPGFLAAIDKALVLDMDKRPRSIAKWRAELLAPAGKPAERVAPPAAPPQGAPEAPAPAATPAKGAVKAKAKPTVAAVGPAAATIAVSPVTARIAHARRKGIIAAFLDGWRKGASPTESDKAVKVMPEKPERMAQAAPKAAAADRAGRLAVPAVPPKARAPSIAGDPVAAPPTPAAATSAVPEPRRAPPKAIRAKSVWPWKSFAAKLAVGAAVAGVAVSLQDHLPKVRSQGGTVAGEANASTPIAQLKGHRGTVTALSFTSDGRSLVTAATDGTIKVWNATSRAVVRTLELEHGAANAMAVDGSRAVTGHKDGTVAIWDLETGAKVASFRRNEASVWSVAFLGEQDRVVAAAQDWSLAIWDVRQPGNPVNVLQGHDNAAQAVVFSPSGGYVASGSADKTVKIWKVDGSAPLRTYRGHNDFVTALAFSPDGRKLVSASLDGQIRVWSTMSSRLHYTLRGHQGRVTALAFAPDGETLASSSDDGTVREWSIKRARSIRTLQSHTGELKAVGFAPDGRRIAAAGADGAVRLYSAMLSKPGT